MEKRKAKRVKSANSVDAEIAKERVLDQQMKEKALVKWIAQIIVKMTLKEYYANDKTSE